MTRSVAEAKIAAIVGKRIDALADHLIDASVLAERYVDQGCKPYGPSLWGTEEATKQTPPALERARIKIVTASVNSEAAILALLAVPIQNTATAVKMAKSIKRLPRKRRETIDVLLDIRELLEVAIKLCVEAEKEKRRTRLRRISHEVQTIVCEALDLIDERLAK